MIKRLRAQSINTNSNTQANSPQLNDISHKKATTEVTSTSKCENKMTISDANEPRPALKLLNILNEKIEEEKKAYPLLQEISRLKEENQLLRESQRKLESEIELEKKLRKQWRKSDDLVYEDMEKLKKQLGVMRAKYQSQYERVCLLND